MNKLNLIAKQSNAVILADHIFHLYVVGESVNSMLALQNLKAFCETYYAGNYHIKLIDVLLSPEQAWNEGVTATPLLVRVLPDPRIKIMGNLNDPQLLNNVFNNSNG